MTALIDTSVGGVSEVTQAELDSETTARIAADNALSASLASEAATRAAADTALSTAISSGDAATLASAAALVDDLSGVTNAATARTNLGLGSLAVLSTITNTEISAGAAIALSKLANQADATILGNNTGGPAAPTALSATQVRTLLSLGTAALTDTGTSAGNVPTITIADARYQGIDAALTSLAGLSGVADRVPYFSGVDTLSLTTFTGAGRTIVGQTLTRDVPEQMLVYVDPAGTLYGMSTVGTGAANTTALEGAMAAAVAAGVPCVIPTGIYTINQTDVPAGCDLRAKPGAVLLHSGTGAEALRLGGDNITLTDLTVDGGNGGDLTIANDKEGVVIVGTCDNIVLRRVTIKNCTSDGLTIHGGATHIEVASCTFTYNRGFHVVGRFSVTNSVTRYVNIHDNYFERNWRGGSAIGAEVSVTAMTTTTTAGVTSDDDANFTLTVATTTGSPGIASGVSRGLLNISWTSGGGGEVVAYYTAKDATHFTARAVSNTYDGLAIPSGATVVVTDGSASWKDCTIQNNLCYICDHDFVAIYSPYTERITVQGNIVDNFDRDTNDWYIPTTVGAGGGFCHLGGTDAICVDNYIRGADGRAIVFSNYPNDTCPRMQGGLITSNTIYHTALGPGNTSRTSADGNSDTYGPNGEGILLQNCTDVTIGTNRVRDTAESGIHLDIHNLNLSQTSKNCAINGNQLQQTAAEGIWVEDSDYVTITGNQFNDCGTDGTYPAVRLSGCQDCTVTGNMSVSAGGSAVLIEDGSENTSTHNQVGANVFTTSARYGLETTENTDHTTSTLNVYHSNALGEESIVDTNFTNVSGTTGGSSAFNDSTFYIYRNGFTARKFRFDASNIASALTRTFKVPSIAATTTLAVVENKLSDFAPTTSDELASVISNETGSGQLVFNSSPSITSPTLTTPVLGTPTSGNLASCTGYPVSALTGLGTNVGTFLATPSSANLLAALTDETGTGAIVAASQPTVYAPILDGDLSHKPRAIGLTVTTTASPATEIIPAAGQVAIQTAAAAGGPLVRGYGSAGSVTSPSANAVNDVLLGLYARSFESGGSAYTVGDVAAIEFIAGASQSGTDNRSAILFKTVPSGSTYTGLATAMRIAADATQTVRILSALGIGQAVTIAPTVALDVVGDILASATIKSKGATSGIGYGTGAGGTQTQGTSKSTGVTLNTICGQITMHNATLNAGNSVGFTLTNSAIATTDVVVVSIDSGATANAYTVTVDAVGAGSCHIHLRNESGSNLGEAVVLNFAVLKVVTS